MSNNLVDKSSFEFKEGVSKDEFDGVYALIADAVHDNILAGTYTGDSNAEGQYITLTKKPRAVLIYYGNVPTGYENCWVMLMLENLAGEYEGNICGSITDDGFYVTSLFNYNNYVYGYVAIC